MGLLADIFLANDGAHASPYDIARGAFSGRFGCQGITGLPLAMLSTAAETWAPALEMRGKPADARSITAGLLVSDRKAARAGQNACLGTSVYWR